MARGTTSKARAPCSRSSPASSTAPSSGTRRLEVEQAAALEPAEVFTRLAGGPDGLSSAEADLRHRADGPNAVRTHGARPWTVLGRQLHSPLLALLAVTAAVSFFVGERADAVIIGVILVLSIGLAFVNEYRAELAV